MTGTGASQVFAVIPAAGQSQRMGRPKQLMPLAGRTMLESVIEIVLAGEIDGLCVVTNRAVDAALALSEDPRFLLALNDDPRSHMLDSVLLGLEMLRRRCALRPTDGLLVCPGDAAGVTAGDVQTCSRAFRREPEAVIVASWQGRRGHPLVFPLSLARELEPPPGIGLKHLLGGVHRVIPVECTSAGVLSDIDTPEDYARLRAGSPYNPLGDKDEQSIAHRAEARG